MTSQRPTLLGHAAQMRKEAFGLSRMFGATGQISLVAADRRHAVARVSCRVNLGGAWLPTYLHSAKVVRPAPIKSEREAAFWQPHNGHI